MYLKQEEEEYCQRCDGFYQPFSCRCTKAICTPEYKKKFDQVLNALAERFGVGQYSHGNKKNPQYTKSRKHLREKI